MKNRAKHPLQRPHCRSLTIILGTLHLGHSLQPSLTHTPPRKKNPIYHCLVRHLWQLNQPKYLHQNLRRPTTTFTRLQSKRHLRMLRTRRATCLAILRLRSLSKVKLRQLQQVMSMRAQLHRKKQSPSLRKQMTKQVHCLVTLRLHSLSKVKPNPRPFKRVKSSTMRAQNLRKKQHRSLRNQVTKQVRCLVTLRV